MLPHHFFIRRNVDAINLVLCNEALQPLDLRSHVVQHTAGFLRDRDYIRRSDAAYIGDVALDDVLGHGFPLRSWSRDWSRLAVLFRQKILGDEPENSHCRTVAVY